MFDEPSWVGGNKYEACKNVFAAEPKDYEVYEYLLKNYDNLKFSPAVKTKGYVFFENVRNLLFV